MKPFARDGDDLVATFTATEAALLSDLTGQISDLLSFRDAEDPALARLLPDAYRDDPEAASEFRRLMEDDLVSRKQANARVVRDTLAGGRVRLDPSAVQSWLRALTDVRLVVASRLGIEHDDDLGANDPFWRDVYEWLGYVQSSILTALEE